MLYRILYLLFMTTQWRRNDHVITTEANNAAVFGSTSPWSSKSSWKSANKSGCSGVLEVPEHSESSIQITSLARLTIHTLKPTAYTNIYEHISVHVWLYLTMHSYLTVVLYTLIYLHIINFLYILYIPCLIYIYLFCFYCTANDAFRPSCLARPTCNLTKGWYRSITLWAGLLPRSKPFFWCPMGRCKCCQRGMCSACFHSTLLFKYFHTNVLAAMIILSGCAPSVWKYWTLPSLSGCTSSAFVL